VEAVRLADLEPGDIVSLPGSPATGVFVARAKHPLWPALDLVVWRLSDGTWSHDALDPLQDVGQAQPSTPERRQQVLRDALRRQGGIAP